MCLGEDSMNSLEKALKYEFKNAEILKKALTSLGSKRPSFSIAIGLLLTYMQLPRDRVGSFSLMPPWY